MNKHRLISFVAALSIGASTAQADYTSDLMGAGLSSLQARVIAGQIGSGPTLGTLSVTGATTLTGAATLGSTLGVTGATTLSSTLNVTGVSTFTGNILAGTSGTTTIGSASNGFASAHFWDGTIRSSITPQIIQTSTNHPLYIKSNGGTGGQVGIATSGHVWLKSPASTGASQLINSSCTLWIDEAAAELQVDCKYSDGTAKTATLAFD